MRHFVREKRPLQKSLRAPDRDRASSTHRARKPFCREVGTFADLRSHTTLREGWRRVLPPQRPQCEDQHRLIVVRCLLPWILPAQKCASDVRKQSVRRQLRAYRCAQANRRWLPLLRFRRALAHPIALRHNQRAGESARVRLRPYGYQLRRGTAGSKNHLDWARTFQPRSKTPSGARTSISSRCAGIVAKLASAC